MLPFLIRRFVWALPTLVFVSLASFLFLSFVPDPTDDPVVRSTLTAKEIETQRRERFADLPRFFDLEPLDARRRSRLAADDVAAGGERAFAGEAELRRLGAAALPHVVPALDAYDPVTRTRVALALAPIAARMRLPNRDDAERPEAAALFWTRFWSDRGVEFKAPAVRTSVDRLARYRTSSRALEVEELDTFALEALIVRLERPLTEEDVAVARALVEVMAHATDRDDRISEGASVAEAQACVDRWHSWWFVYGTDFRTLDGVGAAAALVLETRYGKWAHSIVTSFGPARKTPPAVARLYAGAPATLAIVFGAISIAYAVGIALGVVSAASRGRKSDVVVTIAVLASYAAPTALVAIVLRRIAGDDTSIVWPMCTVALALVAAPTRHQRSALVTALSTDYVRAAVARGAGRWRAVIVHGLRNALVPVVTLVALEPPVALGATFVAERVFGVRGLGALTVEAVASRDTGFLMILSVLLAGVATVALVFADIAHALVDPRTRHKLGRGRS